MACVREILCFDFPLIVPWLNNYVLLLCCRISIILAFGPPKHLYGSNQELIRRDKFHTARDRRYSKKIFDAMWSGKSSGIGKSSLCQNRNQLWTWLRWGVWLWAGRERWRQDRSAGLFDFFYYTEKQYLIFLQGIFSACQRAGIRLLRNRYISIILTYTVWHKLQCYMYVRAGNARCASRPPYCQLSGEPKPHN